MKLKLEDIRKRVYDILTSEMEFVEVVMRVSRTPKKDIYAYEEVQRLVRCKDCAFFHPKGQYKLGDGLENENFCEIVRPFRARVAPDGFCKWGEPKEGEQ